jgi:hypothetical protein
MRSTRAAVPVSDKVVICGYLATVNDHSASCHRPITLSGVVDGGGRGAEIAEEAVAVFEL